MPYTVDDFPDLLRLLKEHPEWRAELRRHVLTEELLELPALVRQLAEAQTRTEQRLQELAEAQARTEQRLVELAAAQSETEKQLAELTRRVLELANGQDRLATEVGELRGESLELRYRARATAYFSRLARRLRVLDPGVLADQLEDAVLAGQLDEAERGSILEADIVLTGKRRPDQADLYIVVEVSNTIDPHDVERAADRAALLERLGWPVMSAVAGKSLTAEAAQRARERSVWQVLDGRATSPSGR